MIPMSEIVVKISQPEGGVLSAEVKRLTPEMARSVLRAANHVGGVIKPIVKSMLNKWGTGKLAESFTPARFVEQTENLVSAEAASDLPYAGIHDDGGPTDGVIKGGKTATMLAIPLTAKARKLWPREWAKDELTLIPSKDSGPALLCTKQGRGKRYRLVPQYVLKKSVRLTPVHYLDVARDASEQGVVDILNGGIGKALQSG
jgi:hypothetical protein